MRHWLAATALFALACGAGESAQSNMELASLGGMGGGDDASTHGAVHTVDMVLEDGKYLFKPAQLTVKVGDTVRWVNVSGGPHNVQFHGDQIPTGAAEVLNTAMPNRMGNLSGKLLIQPNETYEIVFANAPTGSYGYTCTPHELLGMNATLTIEP